MISDVRNGLLAVVRRPGFAALVSTTLGVGIGGSLVMFGLIDGVLLQPLRLPDPDRLVLLREVDREGHATWTSYPNFADWREAAGRFEGMAAVGFPETLTLPGADGPVRARIARVSADYFRVAGVPPGHGRWIAPEENRPGGPPVAVLSHAFWSQVLGAPADLSAIRLSIADEVFQVVGVAPDGFSLIVEPDAWLPLDRAVPWSIRGNHVLPVVGRLRTPDPSGAQRELDRIASQIARLHADETTAVGVAVEPLKEWIVGDAWRPLRLLGAASALLLLVACANVTLGLLARGMARRRELGIRVSLGASRQRLLRQMLAENGVLAVVGAVLGLAVAAGILATLPRIAPGALPRLDEVAVGARTLGFTIAITLLTVLLVGALPALALLRRRTSLVTLTPRTSADARRPFGWRVLVAGQVAAALVLLTGSGLLLRSLWQITTSDVGFEAEGVLTATLDVPGAEAEVVVPRTYRDVVDALSKLPGVEAAGFASHLPLEAGSFVGPVETESGRGGPLAHYRIADAGYFEALGIPLVRGRLFDRGDVAGAPHVVVVNRSLAERYWPGDEPIGQRIRIDGMDPYPGQPLTVIGVVGEARDWRVEPGSQLEYYIALPQRPALGRVLQVVVRARDGGSAALAERVRETVRAVAPTASVSVEWLQDRLAESTADRRLAAMVLSALAAATLLLSAAGIYGVLSYSVASRRREMGIRLALGAVPGQLVASVVGEAGRLLAAGLAVGLLGALALTRLLRQQLHDTDPLNPLVLAGAAGALALVGLLAGWVPAERLRDVDPLQEIRSD